MNDRGAKVRTAAGEIFEADDAVLTVPPSTWSHIRFDPALPAALRPQMGRNVKFLIAARDAFWEKSDASPFSLSDGLINVTWSATDSQPGGDEQGMIAFAGGPSADKLRQAEPDKRDTILRRDLELRYPAFPDSYLRSQFIDWPGQKWTRGSYATPAPGQVTTQGPLMAAGLGRLHFAGEHTCLKFVGFMEGASLRRYGRAAFGGARRSCAVSRSSVLVATVDRGYRVLSATVSPASALHRARGRWWRLPRRRGSWACRASR